MSGPLKGLRILDFTTLLPGPFATMILGDLGAEVLRVEAPKRPDLIRFAPPYDGGESAMHHCLNRNKRSIAIDLRFPEGVEIVKRLVSAYDILLEQFRPGVMDKLGISYEKLQAVNPRLIYCSITGYGQTGPYRDRAGHDIDYISLAGIPSFSHRQGERPVTQAVQIADIGAGSYNSLISVLAAVIHRQQSGEGQYIDISMTDGAISWITPHAPAFLVTGEDIGPEENFINGKMHYYDYYQTRDGRFMAVGSIEPQFYAQLCEGIGRPDIKDQANAEGEELERIKAEMREIFATKTQAEWVNIFSRLDACVEPVLTVREMCEHPQTRAREMIVEIEKPGGGTQRQIGSPFKFSATPPEISSLGPKIGQHTEEVLRGLGYADAEINSLREKEVII